MDGIRKYLTQDQIDVIEEAKDNQDFDKEYEHKYDRRFVALCLNPDCDWADSFEKLSVAKNRANIRDDTDIHGDVGGHPTVYDRADRIKNRIDYVVSEDSPTPNPEEYPEAGEVND